MAKRAGTATEGSEPAGGAHPPLLRAYIAMSLDGYIADRAGGVEWLDAYHTPEIDLMAFGATIGATVMGRTTFDQAIARGPWQFSGERVVVMTRRPIPDRPEGVEAFDGDVRELAADLKEQVPAGKDIWLIGGGDSIRAFHEAGLVDRWEVFVMPVVLGDGVPLFPRRSGGLTALRLTRSKAYSNGIVELWYEPERKAAPAAKER